MTVIDQYRKSKLLCFETSNTEIQLKLIIAHSAISDPYKRPIQDVEYDK